MTETVSQLDLGLFDSTVTSASKVDNGAYVINDLKTGFLKEKQDFTIVADSDEVKLIDGSTGKDKAIFGISPQEVAKLVSNTLRDGKMSDVEQSDVQAMISKARLEVEKGGRD